MYHYGIFGYMFTIAVVGGALWCCVGVLAGGGAYIYAQRLEDSGSGSDLVDVSEVLDDVTEGGVWRCGTARDHDRPIISSSRLKHSSEDDEVDDTIITREEEEEEEETAGTKRKKVEKKKSITGGSRVTEGKLPVSTVKEKKEKSVEGTKIKREHSGHHDGDDADDTAWNKEEFETVKSTATEGASDEGEKSV